MASDHAPRHPASEAVGETDRPDEYDDDALDLEGCWQCGGEGFVADCFEEWACVDPDYGCDLCLRRCDVCRPRSPTPETPKP